MRGQDFQIWLDGVTDSSWDTSVSSLSVASPLIDADDLAYSAANQSTALKSLEKYGRSITQENLATAFKVIGVRYGFPSGRWMSGAADLWKQNYSQSIVIPGGIKAPDPGQSLSGWAESQIDDWWGYLRNSGMGKAATRWISNKAASSFGNGVTALNDVPWVNIVIGIIRTGYRIFQAIGEDKDLKALAPFSNEIPDGYVYQVNPRRYDAGQDSAQGLVVVTALRDAAIGETLTDFVSPRSTAVRLDRVTSGNNVGWLMSADTSPAIHPECQGSDVPYAAGFGFAPGTGAIVDGYQAFAPLHTNAGAGGKCEPQWTDGLRWQATGDMLPTAQAILSTAWQMAMAGNAMQGTIDAPRASRRWQLFARNLAKQILDPALWARQPLNYDINPGAKIVWADFGGTSNACDFTRTLETLWDTAAAQMGWLRLRELVALHPELIVGGASQSEASSGTPAVLAAWAAGASQALGPTNSTYCEQGPAIAGFQGRIEICAPVKALESLQRRQLKNYQGAQGRAAVLLPYARPTDPIVSRFDASDTLSAQGRIDLLNDLLQRPEVCEVDPADIPLPDDGGFEDAVILRQSVVYAKKQQKCTPFAIKNLPGNYAAAAGPPPAVAPGLGLAAPAPAPSGSPGSALAALAAAAGLFYMMRR